MHLASTCDLSTKFTSGILAYAHKKNQVLSAFSDCGQNAKRSIAGQKSMLYMITTEFTVCPQKQKLTYILSDTAFTPVKTKCAWISSMLKEESLTCIIFCPRPCLISQDTLSLGLLEISANRAVSPLIFLGRSPCGNRPFAVGPNRDCSCKDMMLKNPS